MRIPCAARAIGRHNDRGNGRRRARSKIKDFIASATLAKMSAPFGELFYRGLLCNTLVCLAVSR